MTATTSPRRCAAASPHYRRAQLVVLTDKGPRAFADAKSLEAPWINRISEGVSLKDLDAMRPSSARSARASKPRKKIVGDPIDATGIKAEASPRPTALSASYSVLGHGEK